MNTYYLYYGLVLGVLGIGLGIFSILKDKMIAKIISGVVVFFGIGLIAFPYIFSKPEIRIIPPETKILTKKDYTIEKATNNDLLRFTTLHVKGKNLPSNKYAHVITKVAGGDFCWVNSNPEQTDMISDNSEIGYVSLGKKDDPDKTLNFFILVTEEKMESGEVFKYDKLPPYILKSEIVTLKVQGFENVENKDNS